jgi:hypothetical protein
MTSIAVAPFDGGCGVAHRLQDQYGPVMLVPGGEIAKFDDSGGTKSPFAGEIRPANAPG